MAYKIGGCIFPLSSFEKNGGPLIPGFALPFFNGPEQLLVAQVYGDRIVSLQPMDERDNLYVAEADEHFQGACQAVVGQPALYSFRYPVSKKLNIATRAILTPEIENWLRYGPLGESDDVIQQAKEFCDGKMPKALEILYAEMELEALKLRSVHKRRLN